MKSILSILTIVTSTFISNVSGFSSGTGSCAAGIAAIENTQAGNTHIAYAGYPGDTTSTRPGGSGTLTEAATVVLINGVIADPATTTTIPVGTDVTWEVSAQQVAYKGIFVRAEKSSADFTLVTADTTLQSVVLCDALTGVEGLTHLTSAAKTTSSGTLNFASAGTATLDVTLVFDNVANSLYAWSSFALSIEDGAPAAPVAPVAPTPVAAPVATSAPVAETPTAPTATAAPAVAAPTAVPPTAVPPTVDAPTADPPTDECPEGKGKGKGEGKGKGDEAGKGKGGKMSKKGKKCKKSPKEPKTPKAGKGGKGKGSGNADSAVSAPVDSPVSAPADTTPAPATSAPV